MTSRSTTSTYGDCLGFENPGISQSIFAIVGGQEKREGPGKFTGSDGGNGFSGFKYAELFGRKPVFREVGKSNFVVVVGGVVDGGRASPVVVVVGILIPELG